MKKIKINESQFKIIKNLLNEATIEDFQNIDVVTIADPRISIAFGMMFSTDMSGGIISYEILKKIMNKYPSYMTDDGKIFSARVEGSKKLEVGDVFVFDKSENISELSKKIEGSIWADGDGITNFVKGFPDLLSLSKFIFDAEGGKYEKLLFGDLEGWAINIWEDTPMEDVETYLIAPASELPIARLKKDFVDKASKDINIWFDSIKLDSDLFIKNYDDYYNLVMSISKKIPNYTSGEDADVPTNSGKTKRICCDDGDIQRELCDSAQKRNPKLCKGGTDCKLWCSIDLEVWRKAFNR